MKKNIVSSFVPILLIMYFFSFVNNVSAERPDYEKYGTIAIAVVKADYPGEEVIEYKYLGREKVSETDVSDSFQFQVKENQQLKNVIVKVEHNIKNNKLLTLTVKEK